MQLFRCDASRAAQREQFAVAVAAGGVRRDAEIIQHAERAQAHRAQRGLGDLRRLERIFLLQARLVREGGVGVDEIAELLRSVLLRSRMGSFAREGRIGFA